MLTELDRLTLQSLGGMTTRSLIRRVGARGESIPVEHALAIVIGAAARVHAAHLVGARLVVAAESVVVRYDGTVEVRASSRGTNPDTSSRTDVVGLGRLLVELLTGVDLPGELAATIAAAINPNAGAGSAVELARSLSTAARANGIPLVSGELGRWARGDAPAAPSEYVDAQEPRTRLARGSGLEMSTDGELDVDALFRRAMTVTPVPTVAPAVQRRPAPKPSGARAFVVVTLILLVLAGAGALAYYTYG